MDTVNDLGEGALEIPADLEAVVFVIFEALEFLDEVELELRAEPGPKLESNVLVGAGAAAVTSGPRLEPNGSGSLDPLSWGEGEAVEASLIFKGFEFETFKIGIVDLFPDPDEFEGVPISHPTVDEHVIPELFRHVRERDEVLAVLREDGDGRSLDFNAGAFGFSHDCCLKVEMGFIPSKSREF